MRRAGCCWPAGRASCASHPAPPPGRAGDGIRSQAGARPGGRVSLAALRRGFRISVDERALVGRRGAPRRADPETADALRLTARARRRDVPLPIARRLFRGIAQRLAAGGRPRILLSAGAVDADGNSSSADGRCA